MNHLLGNRLFFLIGCVEECRLKESVRESVERSIPRNGGELSADETFTCTVDGAATLLVQKP